MLLERYSPITMVDLGWGKKSFEMIFNQFGTGGISDHQLSVEFIDSVYGNYASLVDFESLAWFRLLKRVVDKSKPKLILSPTFINVDKFSKAEKELIRYVEIEGDYLAKEIYRQLSVWEIDREKVIMEAHLHALECALFDGKLEQYLNWFNRIYTKNTSDYIVYAVFETHKDSLRVLYSKYSPLLMKIPFINFLLSRKNQVSHLRKVFKSMFKTYPKV